ncbi:MAG: hypothetical protein ACLTXL_06405 [Clostridia bacterium]
MAVTKISELKNTRTAWKWSSPDGRTTFRLSRNFAASMISLAAEGQILPLMGAAATLFGDGAKWISGTGRLVPYDGAGF